MIAMSNDALTLQSDCKCCCEPLKVTLLNSGAAKTTWAAPAIHRRRCLSARLEFSAATLRSGEEARQTIAAFTHAIDLDPNFALAYTARARVLVDYGRLFHD